MFQCFEGASPAACAVSKLRPTTVGSKDCGRFQKWFRLVTSCWASALYMRKHRTEGHGRPILIGDAALEFLKAAQHLVSPRKDLRCRPLAAAPARRTLPCRILIVCPFPGS